MPQFVHLMNEASRRRLRVIRRDIVRIETPPPPSVIGDAAITQPAGPAGARRLTVSPG